MAENVTEASGTPIRWSAAVWAGVIAGVVFLVLEMVMVPMFLDGSPWGPPRMIAAMAMGEDVLPPPGTFALVPVMVAMMIHFVLSIVFALVLAATISRMGSGTALLIGTGFGLALYVVNFYGMTAVFPWFSNARNWVSIFAHAVFGLVAATAYVSLAARPPVRTREG